MTAELLTYSFQRIRGAPLLLNQERNMILNILRLLLNATEWHTSLLRMLARGLKVLGETALRTREKKSIRFRSFHIAISFGGFVGFLQYEDAVISGGERARELSTSSAKERAQWLVNLQVRKLHACHERTECSQ